MNFLYCLLFFVTPLLYSPFNFELFEVPKMYFVYSLTLAIITLHLYGWIKSRHPLFRPTPLTIPLLLFLSCQIISTLFSIDIQTSLFGYYSRLNGGLISTVCFVLLYFVSSVHLSNNLQSRIINYSLFSGLLVSLYGIAQHFGIDQTYWVQDVQSRVFSTFGQPNWLAAYLCLLLPFAISKFLNSKTFSRFTVHSSLVTIFYICLLFTKSKTGIITALVCFGLYLILHFLQNKRKNILILSSYLLVLVSFSLVINNPLKDLVFPSKIESRITDHGSQNINITPSQDIRKIVWQGALDLWRQHPLFGTGVETFAYSYYWVRPPSHNLTSEWDFLYNKAHNEYLNFAATTGTFGLLSYLILIFSVLYLFFKSQFTDHVLPITISFLSILIANLTGFSIVITSLYFFLLPALTITPNRWSNLPNHNNPAKTKFFLILLILPIFLLLQIFKLFLADICYAKASQFDSKNQLQPALTQIILALKLSPNQPEYLISAGSITAKLAISSANIDFKKHYSHQSLQFTQLALAISPANTNFWKQSAQNYYYLSSLDPKMLNSSINSLEQVVKLAPTDAKSFYLLGYFNELNKNEEAATKYYHQAITLKSNYDHALFALGKIYFNQKKYSEAKDLFTQILLYAPTNTDAKQYLNEINKLKI
jgi:O-antigen ligase